MKPNKPAAIEPQQVQSKRNSTYHYKPSKSSVAALLQLLHILLQSKRNSTYHYKPSKSECKPRQNGESGQESGGAMRPARACPVARPGGAQHATEPLKASYTSSLRPHALVAGGAQHATEPLKASYTSSLRPHTLVVAGGAQHATEPQRTANERYATHTILHEPYTPSHTYHMNKKRTNRHST